MKPNISDHRVNELLAVMRMYYEKNEEMRQHVLEKPDLNANALSYSSQWLDLAAALDELLERREDEELNRIADERRNDKLIPVNLEEL